MELILERIAKRKTYTIVRLEHVPSFTKNTENPFIYWDSRKNLHNRLVVIPLGFKPKTFRTGI